MASIMNLVRNLATKLTGAVRTNPFGTFAMLLQLVVIFIGMPLQIRQIWVTGNVEGVSWPLFVLMATASCLWGVHAKRELKNNFLLVPQVPAVLMGLVILGQIYYFSRDDLYNASSAVSQTFVVDARSR